MHFLLATTALAASCDALYLPISARATDPAYIALPLEQYETPKLARPLTLEQALSGQNASITTIRPEDLQEAMNQAPTLMMPNITTPLNSSRGLDNGLDQIDKEQGICPSVRTRVEWDSASNDDKQGYINAIKCLMNKPASGQFPLSRNRYDDLVGLHQTLTNHVHGNSLFLLWHRYYLWTFESLLRDECGLSGPLLWFDETRYAGNYPASSIFSSDWFGSVDVRGNCVTNGQFANLALIYGPGSNDRPHCLARSNDNFLTNRTATAMVDACNSRSDYADMATCSEGGAHAAGHNGIGAVMSDMYASPSDPVFFLHHAFIDRNFRNWQNNGDYARVSSVDGSDASGNTLALNTNINVYGFRPDVTIGQVLDSAGPTLCYKYDY